MPKLSLFSFFQARYGFVNCVFKNLFNPKTYLDLVLEMSSEEFFVKPTTNPRIRILSYERYLEETEAGLIEIIRKSELLDRYAIRREEPYPVEVEYQEDPLVFPIFLTIDVLARAHFTLPLQNQQDVHKACIAEHALRQYPFEPLHQRYFHH